MYKKHISVVLTICIMLILIISSYAGGQKKPSPVSVASESDATPMDAIASDSNYVPETLAEIIETSESAEETPTWTPSAIYLNLTTQYAEGADTTDPLDSSAAHIYRDIFERDEDWYDSLSDVFDTKPLNMANRLGYGSGRVMGKYDVTDSEQYPDDPSSWVIKKWSSPTISISDGSGNEGMASNAKEILAMANVYAYYHDWQDTEAVEAYANNLWKRSHSYSISMGQVYYCDGCITDTKKEKSISAGNGKTLQSIKDESEAQSVAESEAADKAAILEAIKSQDDSAEQETAAEETEAQTEAQTEPQTEAQTEPQTESQVEAQDEAQTDAGSEASPSDATQETTQGPDAARAAAEAASNPESYPKCPGHISINVRAVVYGMDAKVSLFDRDNIGNDSDNFNDNWQGWTEEMKNSARILAAKDWYEDYGLSISAFSSRVVLTEDEIQAYMAELPEDISDIRRQVIDYALRSVGNVPYYWGGKASAAQYEPNGFYSVISPDYKGRIFRGLDCSGWINWIYWSVTGEAPTVEGTAGLVNCGSAVSRKNLQPGDIIVRPGTDETIGHVIMFLKWADDGSIICIHETGGRTNNVAIGNMSAYWNYRDLLE